MHNTSNEIHVTVVMPVYNGEAFLSEAIDSILEQTYESFELLVINDGSSDASEEIINAYKKQDNRIRFVNNPENRGVAFTRNTGLTEAKGKYLCWMDCDDICDSDRIKKQVSYLESNSDIGACGTQIQRFKDNGRFFDRTSLNGSPDFVKASLLFRPASIPNATVMLRTDLVRKHGLKYQDDMKISEDFDFISRCSHHFKISILPEVLYSYRVVENSITESFKEDNKAKFPFTARVYKRQLSELGLIPSKEALHIHDAICNTNLVYSKEQFKKSVLWFLNIEKSNRIAQVFCENRLKDVIQKQFFYFAKKASPIGFWVVFHYTWASLLHGYGNGIKNWTKIALRALLRYNAFEFDLKNALRAYRLRFLRQLGLCHNHKNISI